MIRFMLALAAGAVVGGSGAALLATEAAPPQISVTTTAPVELRVVEAPWIDGGVRFRSTVIRPVSFVVGDGAAELEYELLPLHWTAGNGDEPAHVPVRPERWKLITTSGDQFDTSTTLHAPQVRFEVPAGLGAGDVAEVRVDGWRIAVPTGETVTVPLVAGAEGVFSDGTEVLVSTVLEQSSSTIVQLDGELANAEWVDGGGVPIGIADPRWRISFRSGAGAFQAIWEGSDAPGEIDLVQQYPMWVPVAADTVVIGADGE